MVLGVPRPMAGAVAVRVMDDPDYGITRTLIEDARRNGIAQTVTSDETDHGITRVSATPAQGSGWATGLGNYP